MNKHILVACFSASGVTERAAREIAEAVDGELYRITPAQPYTGADLNWMDKESLVITMAEAMDRWAGVDMEKGEDIAYLRKEAERLGQMPAETDTWDDVFNRIFLTYVEPSIPKDRPVYITDFPARIRCLA